MPPSRRKSSRDDILQVFAELVALQGYSDTSIANVADALNLSKGTVVHHFKSKLELLEHVHLAYMQRRIAEAHHILATLSTPKSQLAAMIYALLKSHRDDRSATISFMREFLRFRELTTAVRTERNEYKSVMEGIIKRGIEQGEFRQDDPSLITFQIFGMCNYAWTWYRPEGQRSIEDIARSFIRTTLVGIAAPSVSALDEIDALVDQAIKTVLAAPVTP